MKNSRNGFTLVELLAVIVILAIILVIAVPKVMDIINDAKKGTLESTAKMIASQAEKQKVQNTVLGKDKEVTCDSVAKINDVDYESCEIIFDDSGEARVTIVGSGKFEGLYICNGTKTNAIAQTESCPIPYGDGDTYITKLLEKESELHNGLMHTEAKYTNEEYEEIIVDAGIRYVGPLTGDNAVKNQVYFNCEAKYISDSKTIKYGDEDYVYKDNCEIWRIIGVFEVEDENGTKEQRIKIINTNSEFKASWDSSASGINSGLGVNQWGTSIYKDEIGVEKPYAGADLMQLLNGYYIEKNDSEITETNKKECKYNNTYGQSGFGLTCDTTDMPLSSLNMKPLTSEALKMIDKAVWYTYGTDIINADLAYLRERGITKKYTGCLNTETTECISDNVTRNNEWQGLVGLMSLSDVKYAKGWLDKKSDSSWSISPLAESLSTDGVWTNYNSYSTNFSLFVSPTTYLKSNVEIIDGDGTEGNPYKLK